MRKQNTQPIMLGSSQLEQPQAAPAARRRRKRAVLLFFLTFLIILPSLAAGWAYFIEPKLLTTKSYTLRSSNLPQAWAGKTIAFFSDTHLGVHYTPAMLQKAADAIMLKKPDIILFGGDLIDHKTPVNDEFAQAAAAVLDSLSAPLGKFAVAGNHDNRLRAEYLYMARILEAGGFTILNNESVLIDNLWLAGLAESYFGNPDLEQAYSQAGLIASNQLPDHPFRLLLMHQPDYAAGLEQDSFDLALSGHSHNGQVTFFGKAIYTVHEGRQYPYGHYKLKDGRQLVVSRGLGTVGLPLRLFAPPELVFITLELD